MAAPPDNLSKTDGVIPSDGQGVSPETPVTAGAVGRLRSVMLVLGPGLVTGASDDDPSSIATYSEIGRAIRRWAHDCNEYRVVQK